jgi:predicted ATPase
MRAGVQRAVVQLVSALAGESALLLALEDAHWADLSTLQLADELAAMSSLALAIVVFARPELRARLGGIWAKRGPLQVDLAPLGERGARRLARALLPDGVPEHVVVDIASKSDGIPLVIEELVRAYVNAGEIVASLTARTVFEASIGRLSPRERLVIRAAAIVGELFWDGSVRACVAGTGIELDEVLADLAGHEMITRRPSSRIAGSAEYLFRHALLRDAAAASTPDDVRKDLHRAVATWLQSQTDADAAQKLLE